MPGNSVLLEQIACNFLYRYANRDFSLILFSFAIEDCTLVMHINVASKPLYNVECPLKSYLMSTLI